MAHKIEQKSPSPEQHDHYQPGLPLFINAFAAIICGVLCCCVMEYSQQRQQTLQMITTRPHHTDFSLPRPESAAPELSPVHRHYGSSANPAPDASDREDTPSGFRPYTRATILPPGDSSPAVLYFHASWSGNCQRMGNTLKNSSDVQQWKSRLRIIHVDSQKHPDLCKKYAVTDFPTLLFLAADGTTVRPLVGNRPVAQILAFLENNAGQQEITAAEQKPERKTEPQPEVIPKQEPEIEPETTSPASTEAAQAKPRVRLHQLHRNLNQNKGTTHERTPG